MSTNDWFASAALSWYGTGSKDCPCMGGGAEGMDGRDAPGAQGKLLFAAVPRNWPVEGWLFHCKPEVFLGVPPHEPCGKAPEAPIVPPRSGEGAPHCGQGISVAGREALQYVQNIVTHRF